jgi:hypothetical protein
MTPQLPSNHFPFSDPLIMKLSSDPTKNIRPSSSLLLESSEKQDKQVLLFKAFELK